MVEISRTALVGSDPSISLDQIVANLQQATQAANRPSLPVSSKHAAVLVPLFEADNDIYVILTQRNPRMRAHAGEVCFAGGKREKSDLDDVATALREANEELGIDPSCVNVIGSLPPVLSKHLLSVTPVLATVPPDLTFFPNPDEVEHVFTAPLRMFLRSGPGYSYRDVHWENIPYRLHYWDYTYTATRADGGEHIRPKNFVIWGLTAGMLIAIAEQAFQRKPDFQVHTPGAMPYTALAFENGKLVFRGHREGGDSGVGFKELENPGTASVTDAEMGASAGIVGDEDDEDGGSPSSDTPVTATRR